MSHVDVHKFHYAVVSKIPESFARNAHIVNKNIPIDLNLATRQHDEYVDVLRRLGIDILELPPDERHPECVFVADVAVVINGTALICKPSDRRIGELTAANQTIEFITQSSVLDINSEEFPEE
ncbi:DDAH1 [Bugula neritina]|uniref:DDAH1 n=1 Tax=Bugula neritina TaxID=10212 RepID=A0A7J7KIP0_BUGNE|nr:DDAH1 [Bugula neritina]